MDRQAATQRLLYCLGRQSDQPGLEALEQLSPSDWDDVVEESIRHGVSALLYHRLTGAAIERRVPSMTMQRLRELYLLSARENTRRYHFLLEVLTTLRARGIPVIVLKGVYLAEIVYGNIALRMMRDIDILVKEEDVHRTVEALFQMGCAVLQDRQRGLGHDSETNQYYIPAGFLHFPTLRHPTEQVHIDVHCSMVKSRVISSRMDMQGLWKRARPVSVHGIETLALSPEDQLLHLCLHVSIRHLFVVDLRSLCDISATIQHYSGDIDWTQIQERARQWRIGEFVSIALCLASKLMGAAVPAETLDALWPQGTGSRSMAWVEEQLLAAGDGTADDSLLNTTTARLWGPARWQDKVALLLSTAFPSRDLLAHMYAVSADSPRIYLYYLLRLKDILLRFIRETCKILRGDEEVALQRELLSWDR